MKKIDNIYSFSSLIVCTQLEVVLRFSHFFIIYLFQLNLLCWMLIHARYLCIIIIVMYETQKKIDIDYCLSLILSLFWFLSSLKAATFNPQTKNIETKMYEVSKRFIELSLRPSHFHISLFCYRNVYFECGWNNIFLHDKTKCLAVCFIFEKEKELKESEKRVKSRTKKHCKIIYI